MHTRSPTAWRRLLACVLLFATCGAYACAQPADLSAEQAQLQEKFERLESLAVRIAELVEIENPDRAQQLRGAIATSRELALSDRFEAIVGLLENERYAAAQRDQGELADNLETLLGLLLADPREARLEAERERLKQAIKDVGRLIREQRSLRSETLDSEDLADQAGKQDALADDAEGVGKALGEGAPAGELSPDGQPSQAQGAEGEPAGPSQDQGAQAKQRASQRLSEAKSAMQKASGQMGEGDSQGASDAQTEAQRQLEQAREELEEALRQTREEEATRMLTRLAARLRGILSEQTEINRLTIEVHELHGEVASPQKRSATAGLAKRQDEAAMIVERARRLVEEEGSSIAFAEVLDQVNEDMGTVSGRLQESDAGGLTQAIEQDIVAALEDAIEALDAQLAEMANREQQPPSEGQQQGGQMQEPPLVDQLAELRMIRSLQRRILQRTKRAEQMGEELSEQELLELLQRLSLKQQRALKAAERLVEE
ncbi:hypothetical protein Pla123a_26100 [Posidoniimonas polymericola]|uniref:Chromosome partition protein Smc n=1 Tax=Posidoniimonas polymericola TaxID=2528002 RepID=A0A5C5YM46_9BACT|nr:DUF4175 domain-containing protein [Posidoniimonas polymericola]TWT75828.1 hypothetical protein Pla123a_26100 [Posidoniimonas polymericola]